MSGVLSKRDDFTASIFVLPAVFFCCFHLKVRMFALSHMHACEIRDAAGKTREMC